MPRLGRPVKDAASARCLCRNLGSSNDNPFLTSKIWRGSWFGLKRAIIRATNPDWALDNQLVEDFRDAKTGSVFPQNGRR